jgi:hypothetical protein
LRLKSLESLPEKRFDLGLKLLERFPVSDGHGERCCLIYWENFDD